jgi:multidrug transporter EmrE-like cation transporter
MGYLYIFLTILLTVYGQLVIKWRMSLKGTISDDIEIFQKIMFMIKAFMDVWIISGLLAAFLASFTWAAALTKFELSFAYPFMSLSFVLVFILSLLFFGEAFTWQKMIGMILIILGVLISSGKNL